MSDTATAARLRAATDAVWTRVRDSALAQVDTVEAAVLALLAGDLAEDLRREGERAAHRLAGSAGTFGYAAASTAARELEQLLAEPRPGSEVRAAELVERLNAELRRDPGDGPGQPGEPDQPENAAATAAGAAAAAAPAPNSGLVLVVDGDDARAVGLSAAARARGIEVALAADLASATQVLASRRPTAAVMNLGSRPPAEVHALLSELAEVAVPVLATGSGALTADRLEAARAGAAAFLDVSVSASSMLDEALVLAGEAAADAPRVLVVDDDPAVLAAVEAVLSAVGLAVDTLGTPARFWETLLETEPDLVLLDIDMPEIDGLELCRSLRADPRWRSLPTIFLSARSGAETKGQVYAAGADDFVSKPVVAPELQARVRNRLERTRLHRLLAETDPLTGLANRRKAEHDLARLQRLADRSGRPLSLAVVDVDRFKRVNDRYGHAAGDAVLQHLAATLSREFRGDDLVGRLGGEEFVVGMLGLAPPGAARRLDEVLQGYRSAGTLLPDGRRLAVGASAGVAAYPADGREAGDLYRAADAALAVAKRTGRGRVLVAGEESGPLDRVLDLLVVEDDEVVAELLRTTFTTDGLRCAVLGDGAEALERLTAAADPVVARVVLLDIDLPGRSGFEVLQGLSAAGVLAETRVIVLSARATEAEALRALAAGAWDHVGKPFSVPLLLEKVRHALGERRGD